MAFPRLAVLGLALVLTVAGLACDKGGGSSDGEQTGGGENTDPGAGGAQPSTGERPAAQWADFSDPRQLGEVIGQHYVDMMLRLRELVESRPELATLRPQLEALKEQYIQTFVELGHRVEAIDRAQRRPVNSAVFSAMGRLPDFEWFNSAREHYHAQDPDFANFLASFNVMTQYAFFDLLRQQEPEEAERLGVAH